MKTNNDSERALYLQYIPSGDLLGEYFTEWNVTREAFESVVKTHKIIMVQGDIMGKDLSHKTVEVLEGILAKMDAATE